MRKIRSKEELSDRLARYLRDALDSADLTYSDLAERMTKLGYAENENSIKQKFKRNSFSGPFLIAAAMALKLDVIDLAAI
jgi:phage anti-repressor protein